MVRSVENARAMSMSSDGKIVAMSFDIQGIFKILIAESSKVEVIEEIEVEDLPLSIEFMQENQTLVYLHENGVKAIDLITLETLYEIKMHTAPWSKLQILQSEDMIAFEDQ